MSQITEISSNILQMIQTQLQDRVNVQVLKIAIDAEKQIATQLLESVDKIQEFTASTEGHIDLFV